VCGIAGYVGTRVLEPSAIECALELMHRRGPDNASHAEIDLGAGRRACLLATRLDIIDLHERANQPFRRNGATLVYNGELYNYRELRDALPATFATESDTEVLAAALEAWGDDALDRCEGMWAFALHRPDGSVTLARDRFGEKPLYLHRDDTGLYFASEPKALFALLGGSLPVNEAQVRRFLAQGYRALYKTGETFFAGLDELPPATVLRIAVDGREDMRRYWEPSFAPDSMSYNEAVDGVRDRLVRSVELRLRADVPLAFCMSGGVDSNALIAIAKRECGFDVHGFTVMNADARYEERDAVEGVVDELGIRHTQSPVTASRFLEGLRELVAYHDAPVYTISYYAHWQLMQLIAGAGYKVAVSGTAADELFTGYYDHHLAYLSEVRDEHAVARWREHVLPLVRNPKLRDPELFVRDPAYRAHLSDVEESGPLLTNGRPEAFRERTFTTSLLRNRMLNELTEEVVPVILHEDDANAMYWSVENRSPYLDRELVEFSYRVPTEHLVRDGYAKAVLRDAVRGIAPDHVVENRRKVGFNAPIFDFLDREDRAVREELLSDSPIFDYVRRDGVAALLDEPEPSNARSKLLFSILSTKAFLEEHA
jgi:asparagine synthase (glutamine-hydrolysing)